MKLNALPPIRLLQFLLLVVTLWVYSPVFKAGFVYDDLWRIMRNPALRVFDPAAYFTQAETVAAVESGLSQDIYQPLTTLSFAVDFRLWGLNPLPYHLENVLLHLFNGFLLWLFLRRLLSSEPGALFGTAIFLLHPVQVQTVAWISQRSNLLCLLGILSALNCAFLGKSPLRFLAAGLTYAFALAAKETAVVFPALFCALCLLFRQSSRDNWRFLFKVVLLTLAYLFLRRGVLQHWSQGVEGPWLENLGFGLLAFPVYIGKLLAPLALRPSYSYPDLQPILLLGSFVVVLAYGWAVYQAWLRYPIPATGLLWLLIGLLPVLQIIPIRIFVGERYLYLPIVGLAWIMGWVWQRYVNGRWAYAVWLGTLVLITATAVPNWRTQQSLWAYAIRQEPQNAFAQASYGDVAPDPATAQAHYRLALLGELSPGVRFATLNNMSAVCLKQDKPRQASAWAQEALRLQPDDWHALYNLCLAYDRLGQRSNAGRVFQKLTRLPGVPPGLLEDLRKKAPRAAGS